MPRTGETADRQTVETRVLEIVEALVAELRGAPAPGAVTLDRSLERDLGIGSLERVELLLRLEQAFDVRLGEEAMASAETARDLVRALAAARPLVPEAAPVPAAPIGAGRRAPGWARTLGEVLRWHVDTQPDRAHIFLVAEDGTEQTITHAALWTRAAAVAAGLRERGVGAGHQVALMLRTEEPFFAAFFGTLLAGAVPVPIYPPYRPDRIEEYAQRQARILANAEARLLVTFERAERVAGLLSARVPTLRGVTTVERLARSGALAPPPDLGPDSPALIQYTSGSTGDPKGVLLSHANLLANIRALGRALAVQDDDVMVSWLPLYHDMGLIGAWLGPLYFAVPTAILSPLAFLARPACWLRALHARRGTLSPAPNFAFDLCVRKVRDEELRGVDLSTWRLALNGSEPVSAETLERFARRFAPWGYRAEAMCPVYGLAEASVGLTYTPPGRGAHVDRVAREALQRRRVAEPASPDDAAALRVVSCGVPLPDHEVRIVDAAGRPVPERVVGRIEFRGPSVAREYFRNAAATRATFHQGWCDSGDLGYWAGGELFITGRVKDLIIKAGRNLHPTEIEEVAGEVPGIRKGCVAAFGVADPATGTERFVVVAETREAEPARRAALEHAVLERVAVAVGVPPDTVVITGPGAVLKTPSGKVRRSAMREAWLQGTLGRQPSAGRQWARLVARAAVARLAALPGHQRRAAEALRVLAVMSVGFPVLWTLLLCQRRAATVDRTVRVWSRLVLRLAGFRLRVEGGEHVPARGPVVFAANHSSYLDAIVLLAALPADFRFVAKRELLGTPLVRQVVRKVGHLTVERLELSQSVADAERVSRALRAGTSLFFFPEGTLRLAPGLLPFKLGAFKSAVEAGCPVVPVGIRGTREAFPADAWLPRPRTITISIGAPLVPAGSAWREMVRLRDLTRAEVARRAGAVPEPAGAA